MRIFVMYDLPVLTSKNRKDYRDFRKYLITNGFIMLQESVYCKLVPNSNIGTLVVDGIKKNKPPVGNIEILRVTEKQFIKMEYIVGENTTSVINSDERLIIL